MLRVDPGQNAGEAFHGGLGACAVHPGEGHEEGLALHQGADGGTVVSALDGVAFPVARDKALLDLGGAVVDADGVGDLVLCGLCRGWDGACCDRSAAGR